MFKYHSSPDFPDKSDFVALGDLPFMDTSFLHGLGEPITKDNSNENNYYIYKSNKS